MKKYFILLFLFSIRCFGFTLMYPAEPSFIANEINVDYYTANCPASYDIAAYVKPAIDQYWNTTPFTRLKLKVGSLQSQELGNDGAIFVTCGTEYYFQNDPAMVIGFASLGVSGSTIQSASVLIRASHDWSGDSDARKINVLAHEIGHAIGFGHSEARCTMLSGDPLKYQMDADDHAAMQYLYGRDEFKKGQFGCGMIQNNFNSTPSLPSLFLMIVPLIFTLWLRKSLRQTYWGWRNLLIPLSKVPRTGICS